jgi:HSP20 family molecular chaperone IbpA
MRVALRNPIAGKLGEEFDRVFDRLLAPRLHTEPLLPPFPFESAGAEWMPVMDVIETAEGYVVRLEAPGIHKENLELILVGEILTITG